MEIKYARQFIKEFEKCPAKIKFSFKQRLDFFIDNKYSPILNNHPLTGEYNNCRSININGDWRAIFREADNGAIIYFLAIGTHSQLYS
jgi:addiction module RelE/StbE family toxin